MTELVDQVRAAYRAAALACPHIDTVLAEGDAGYADADGFPPAVALQIEVPDVAWPTERQDRPAEISLGLTVWTFTRGQDAAVALALDLDARLREALASVVAGRLLRVAPPEGIPFARHDADLTIARPQWVARYQIR